MKQIKFLQVLILLVSCGFLFSCTDPDPNQSTIDLDHFLVYTCEPEKVEDESVQLKGRYDDSYKAYTVVRKLNFLNPVSKIHKRDTFGILNIDHHFNWYGIRGPETEVLTIEFDNQFGDQKVVIGGPVYLISPSGKRVVSQNEKYEIPEDLDHYKVYTVLDIITGIDVSQVQLKDQFTESMEAGIISAKFYAIPVEKVHLEKKHTIHRANKDLVFYNFNPGDVHSDIPKNVFSNDQFGKYNLDVKNRILLGVPTNCDGGYCEIPEIDHFMVYDMVARNNLQLPIELYNANMEEAVETEVNDHINFLTPSHKTHDQSVSPILHTDFHASWYRIQPVTAKNEVIKVCNQFGEFELSLADANTLMAPSGKILSNGEKYNISDSMSHYLLYVVNKIVPGEDQFVEVGDQFIDKMKVRLAKPVYYARPVQKKHGGVTHEIGNNAGDILFYDLEVLDPKPSIPTNIEAFDQFFRGNITLQTPRYYGVPTLQME